MPTKNKSRKVNATGKGQRIGEANVLEDMLERSRQEMHARSIAREARRGADPNYGKAVDINSITLPNYPADPRKALKEIAADMGGIPARVKTYTLKIIPAEAEAGKLLTYAIKLGAFTSTDPAWRKWRADIDRAFVHGDDGPNFRGAFMAAVIGLQKDKDALGVHVGLGCWLVNGCPVLADLIKAAGKTLRVDGKPELNETDRTAAKYITDHPGRLGKVIADAIDVSKTHFRQRIVPKLKKHGFTNKRDGDGYFPPSSPAV